jgi:ribosomal protein S18 acetylase RimI-like enzyme
LQRFIDHNGYDTSKTNGYGHIIKAISPKKGLFDLFVKDCHVGCGLGVVHRNYLGIFDIVIHPEYRRRGYGRKIMESIIAWGKMNGAEVSYLQVMTDNPEAIDLYDKIGFREIYKYWYRVKID